MRRYILGGEVSSLSGFLRRAILPKDQPSAFLDARGSGCRIKTIIIAAVFFAGNYFIQPALAQSDKDLFSDAVNAARMGNKDAAFMYFHAILNSVIEPAHEKEALFASGEYYFSSGNYSEAIKMFSEFLEIAPQSKARIFALAYILKIARQQQIKDVVEELKKEIISAQQLSLLFSDYKKVEFLSPLCNRLCAFYYIDKVKFYLNEDPFEEISF